jgi:hypothetical protein
MVKPLASSVETGDGRLDVVQVGHVVLLVLVLVLFPLASSGAPMDDEYIKGYASAILERQFNVSARSLQVKDGVVTLSEIDVPRLDRPKVMTELMRIKGVARVELLEVPKGEHAKPGEPPAQLPVGHLFWPLIADPRWPHFSAAYRNYFGNSGLKSAAAVSFGETLSLWRDNLSAERPWGQWEVGLQAGVFSIFDLDSPSFDLINTDFFIAAFGAYRFDELSALTRIFHQSSHLGDELLLRSTHPDRINLSYEGVDAKVSYDLPLGLRTYGGGGYLFDVDPPHLGRGSIQTGVEFRSPKLLWHGRLRPIAGLDLQFREENRWHRDLSLRAGIQLEGTSVLSRNFQLLLEYFNGNSFEGQFFVQPVEYLGLGVHYNF